MQLPTAHDLIACYGAKEVADMAVPANMHPLMPEEIVAVADGGDVSQWEPEAQKSAIAALARIETAISRAGTELAFYLRDKPDSIQMPAWLHDDALELARYHLHGTSGTKDSTIRLRYQDVIKRLTAQAEEWSKEADDPASSAADAVKVQSRPRLFSRKTLRRL